MGLPRGIPKLQGGGDSSGRPGTRAARGVEGSSLGRPAVGPLCGVRPGQGLPLGLVAHGPVCVGSRYFVMLTAQVGPHQLAASEGERCPGPAQAVLAGPALCRQRLPLPAGLPSPVC